MTVIDTRMANLGTSNPAFLYWYLFLLLHHVRQLQVEVGGSYCGLMRILAEGTVGVDLVAEGKVDGDCFW